jgi:hypothetical protein
VAVFIKLPCHNSCFINHRDLAKRKVIKSNGYARSDQQPFSISIRPAPDSLHPRINIPQKLFHGKPLQSSWKGVVAWNISLENINERDGWN